MTIYTIMYSYEKEASRSQNDYLDLVTASRTCSALFYQPVFGKTIAYIFSTATLVSINTVLTVACLFLYLSVWRSLRSDVHVDTAKAAIIHLYWRLSLIVAMSSASWVSLTVIEWYKLFNINGHLTDDEFFSARFILFQFSPTVNPFIYTLTGSHFGRSMKRCWKYLRCRVSLGRSRYRLYGEDIGGVRRCSCVPCVECVRPWEYFDTEEQVSEETEAFVSNAGPAS